MKVILNIGINEVSLVDDHTTEIYSEIFMWLSFQTFWALVVCRG